MIEPLLFIGLIFLPMGVLFVALGVLIPRYFKKRQNRASCAATATIVEIIRDRSRRSNSMTMNTYFPVFEYDANGEVQRVRSAIGSSPCRYQVGEQVELHFNPDNPCEIFVERDLSMLLMLQIVFCGVGGLFAILGMVFLYMVII